MDSRQRNLKLISMAVIFLPVLFLLSACSGDIDVGDEKEVPTVENATLVLKNGNVYTMEEEQPTAEAVATKDGEIIFVGSTTDVEKYVGDDTEVIDLEGKFLSPGFLDGHMHAPGIWPNKLFAVDQSSLNSHEENIQAVADFMKKNPDAKIVTGHGWKNGPYELEDGTNPGPTKEELDAVAPDIPVILTSVDAHSVWVNSKALEMAGIDKDTQTPPGGLIERNPDGSPRGVLREGARNLVDDVKSLYELTEAQYKEAILAFQEEMYSYGMTGILTHTDKKVLEVLGEMDKEEELKIRVAGSLFVDEDPEKAVTEVLEARKKYNSDWLQVNTAKLFADGVTEGKTALYLDSYTENAGMGDDHHGESSWEVEDFNKVVSELDKENVQVHVHAIGDGAVNMGLNAIEKAKEANGESDSRHTITHISSIQDSDISRMEKMNVIASLQPFWFYKDQYYELEKAMVGEDRALAMYPTRKMWDAGVLIANSSDHYATPDFRPLFGIETGITRNSPYPAEQDTNMVRNIDQALTIEEMLQSFTKNVAYQMFREDDLGSLKVGKKADMVVLEQDITKSKPKDISETSVIYTIVDGEIVYKGK